jgi:hypothetical protein
VDVVQLLGRLLFASAFLISPSGVLQAAPRLAGSPALKAYPRWFAIAAVRTTCVFAMGGAVLLFVAVNQLQHVPLALVADPLLGRL